MTSPPFAICSDDDDAFGAVGAVAPARTNTACATADDGVSPFPARNASHRRRSCRSSGPSDPRRTADGRRASPPRRSSAGLVAAEDRDRRLAGRGERGHDAVARFQRARRRAKLRSRSAAASDFAPTKIVAPSAPSCCSVRLVAGPSGGPSPTSRTRAARRCCSPPRARRTRLLRQHDARVDEVDGAVAVAILEARCPA